MILNGFFEVHAPRVRQISSAAKLNDCSWWYQPAGDTRGSSGLLPHLLLGSFHANHSLGFVQFAPCARPDGRSQTTGSL